MVDVSFSEGMAEAPQALRSLGQARRGDTGTIARVTGHDGALPAHELERRLLELGFVEGARIEVLHEGLFGRDPIALRVDDGRVALRRREAAAVLVHFDR